MQVVRVERWARLLLTHWFRVRPPGAPPAKQDTRLSICPIVRLVRLVRCRIDLYWMPPGAIHDLQAGKG
jgi:hypothetical protein